LEVVLCDYADGVLELDERQAVESHLSACAACSEFLRDIQAAAGFLRRVESPEPPPELVTRILYHAPGGGAPEQPAPERARGFGGWFRGWFLQPRFVMGMAMTMLSFSMVARIMGVPQRPPTMADFEPARVWASLDDKLHRGWDRAVKYYENLRLVYEIQARLQEWSREEESERKSQSGGALEPSSPGSDRGAGASVPAGSGAEPAKTGVSGSEQGKQKGSVRPEGAGSGTKSQEE
jgi:hypothetical protein